MSEQGQGEKKRIEIDTEDGKIIIIINNILNTGNDVTQSAAGKESAVGDSQISEKSSNTAQDATEFNQRETE